MSTSDKGQPGKPAAVPKGQVGNQPGTAPKDGAVEKANETDKTAGQDVKGSTSTNRQPDK